MTFGHFEQHWRRDKQHLLCVFFYFMFHTGLQRRSIHHDRNVSSYIKKKDFLQNTCSLQAVYMQRRMECKEKHTVNNNQKINTSWPGWGCFQLPALMPSRSCAPHGCLQRSDSAGREDGYHDVQCSQIFNVATKKNPPKK